MEQKTLRIRRSEKKRQPKILTVTRSMRITPNMVRITLHGEELAAIPPDCEGANCKLLLPAPGQSRAAFLEQVENGPRPVVRTYTIRHARPGQGQIDIDFALHTPEGPATLWARDAAEGDFLALLGPGPVKIDHYAADYYVIAADMSAIPLAAATLEAMPRDARGIAVFEITSPEDRQKIDAPARIEQHWFVHADPHTPSSVQEEFLRQREFPDGRIQTCIAGESSLIASLRKYVNVEMGLPREDTYVSGYWKIGLVEDEHQKLKRAETA